MNALAHVFWFTYVFILKSGIPGSSISIYSDLANIARQLFKEAVPIYTPTSRGLGFQSLHILANAWQGHLKICILSGQ